MHIVHGTWVPGEPGQFVQDGAFCLWVEADAATKRRGAGASHPRHLADRALETFLNEKFGIRSPYEGSIARTFSSRRFLLPTAGGTPLPSNELMPYMEVELPDEWELASWEICCYPLPRPIEDLNDIHFTALHGAEDFQLGADFLFWHQYSQVLKEIIAGDHYIPSLRYRALMSGKGSKDAFELYPGWELLSDAYESAIDRYVACMPAVCAAAEIPRSAELWSPETLLRHFSERVLHRVVAATPVTAKLDQQIAGTPLHDCVHPLRPIPGTDAVRETCHQWASWRRKLTAGQTGANFTLCFRLEEAPVDDVDAWSIQFLVASKRDPSLKLTLADYWMLTPAEKALFPYVGADFEKHLLLALGFAARIYPKVWSGMDTDQPVGFDLTLEEVFSFLKEDAWVLEDAGYTLIVPAWCTPEGRRRARVRARASASVSGTTTAGKSYFSLNSLVDYRYQLSVGGEVVSEAEWEQLLAAKTPLVQFRGQWMEVDRERMREMLTFWQERQQTQPEMTLLDLMKAAGDEDGDIEWEYDDALRDVLSALEEKRVPEVIGDLPGFSGTLREYQRQGVAWLRYLERLGLNPCLADDMGLGKTIQVIAQLVAERNENDHVEPTLLVAPTSVLGNWRREIERFAPQLRTLVHQGSTRIRDEALFQVACDDCDVVITSFALARLDEKLLRRCAWRRLVVDEAQNIKNPKTAQTRAIAKLPAQHRLALTGTPVENRLLDLWSIFNFLNPGYLGKEAQFRRSFEIPIQRDNDIGSSATLKKLIEPFILRRLKTDKNIIADLPDKIEQKVYCNLTPEQASLYELVVKDATGELENVEGIERRGLILATLTKLKQICNHPAQFLQDSSAFSRERSHKLQRLSEMMEEVLDNGESLLIFTQFTEIGAALERHIKRTHGCPTYYLHGGTSAKKRDELVATFQDPESPPGVFILSLRAGGTGLTLTKANHVFHFDRWWNPAVEDQATDRAFRIGQRKNVFAHKFVTAGTVEERIDQMIEDKKGLARNIVSADESWLTELDNQAFKDLIALRQSAIVE